MNPINIGEIIAEPFWPPDPSLLLHPTIPREAHGLNPRSVLGKDWWDSTRKSAEDMNNHFCYACSIHKSDTVDGWLEGHETYMIFVDEKVLKYLRTVSLCKKCHMYIHCGRTFLLWQERKLSQDDFVAVMAHGVQLLRGAGLPITTQQATVLNAAARYLTRMQLKMFEGFIHNIDIVAPSYERGKARDGVWKLIIGEYTYTDADILGDSPEEDSH